MSEITASRIVDLIEGDKEARRRLAAIIASDPDTRLAIINAALLELATKKDLDKLEGRIARLEERIDGVDSRLSRVEGQLSLFIKLFIAFNIPILVGIVGILLGLALRLI